MDRRVVVSGLGVVCGLGFDWPSVWSGLLAGRSAIRPWKLPEVDSFPVQYAAAIDDAPFAQRFSHIFSHIVEGLNEIPERRMRFGLAATMEACADAGLAARTLGDCGVAFGSGVPEWDWRDVAHGIDPAGSGVAAMLRNRDKLNSPSVLCSNDSLAARVAEHCSVGGPVLNISTACAGAAHAIGLGFRMIRRGEVERMIVGGADSVLNLTTMVGLHLLGAPSTSELHGNRLCRPFDRDRSGLVAAEGAAVVVLERADIAQARGARIYAEVAGFGSSLDAYRITAPHPEGRGAALAMHRALQDAAVRPTEVACVNAHGTSTPLNDPAETCAIKTVFAEAAHYRRLLVTANKSMAGHLIAAAGALEFVATALSVREGIVPPTINLDNPDPACDLDYVPYQARCADVPVAISNSFGFGGLNAALVVRRYAQRH